MAMDKDDVGAQVDRLMDDWRHDLEAMRGDAAALPDEAGAALCAEVEELRREFQGLRIKKVATWHAPESQWEAASTRFDEMWGGWVERARAVRNALDS